MAKLNCLVRLGVLALVAIAASATRARAASSPPPLFVVLSYRLDPELRGCPGEAEFRDSVVKQLGYDPFRNEAAHRVVAEVAQSMTGIEGHIAWADSNGNPEGERRLSSLGSDCDSFLENMAFAIAVQIQLLNGAESDGAESNAANGAPPASALPPPPPSPPTEHSAHESPAAQKWSLAMGAGPLAELAVAPSLAEGFRLFAAVRSGSLSLELSPELTFPVTWRRDDGSGFSVTTRALTLVPCVRRAHFALCAVGMLGVLAVHGFGVDDARSPSSFVAKAGLRLAFDQPLSRRWALAAHADGLGMLTPRTVSLNEVPVWTTPNLGLQAGIDLTVLLP